MKRTFFIFVILLFPFVQSITIEQGTIFNTTSSNSSITFDRSINATNLTIYENRIIIKDINFTNSTQTYSCEDVNYSNENDNLNSSEFNCTDSSSNGEDTSESQGSGGSSSYVYQKDDKNIINLKIKMDDNQKKELEIKDSKNTNLKKIIINSNKRIEDEINISKLELLPQCIRLNQTQSEIYNMLRIETKIKKEAIKNISLFFEINSTWISQNNITEILGYKCSPEYSNLNSKLYSSQNENLIYRFDSDYFSDWVIYGQKKDFQKSFKEKIENDSQKSLITGRSIDMSLEDGGELKCTKFLGLCWYFWFIILIAIISLIIIYIRSK